MTSLAIINRRIRELDPCVELVRGTGYHYFVFDCTSPAGELVFECESVMEPYTSGQPAATWIRDGVLFGARIREQATERGIRL